MEKHLIIDMIQDLEDGQRVIVECYLLLSYSVVLLQYGKYLNHTSITNLFTTFDGWCCEIDDFKSFFVIGLNKFKMSLNE